MCKIERADKIETIRRLQNINQFATQFPLEANSKLETLMTIKHLEWSCVISECIIGTFKINKQWVGVGMTCATTGRFNETI